jgi:phosphoenolpyruvate carboxykinase (GTP)
METDQKGIDIINTLGGFEMAEDAISYLKTTLDQSENDKLARVGDELVLLKIANAISLCNPDSVFIHTGSDEDLKTIRKLSLKNKEESSLQMENHTIHFDLKEEQGRIIDRTFYIVDQGEEINSLAAGVDRSKALNEVRSAMKGIMQGKTMIVGFYLRGPLDSPVTNPALQITSSAYVVHSADILYRCGYHAFTTGKSHKNPIYINLHSEGRNRGEDLANARVFMDRAQRTTISFNCTYAGNSLMLKKGNHRFSVDRAVYDNRGEELAEHMFITGLRGPGERVTYFAGAAPSGCGKTTTAMTGDHLVGDDLAQMWIDEKGSICTINPEKGIFGILEDVNREGDPTLMKNLRSAGTEVIWSNVLVDDEKTPHWTGSGEQIPPCGINHQGTWKKGLLDADNREVRVSHPNARFTLALDKMKNVSSRIESPHGVETRVITYSGRDSDTMPPVWVAESTDHGVVIGACIVSATTATEVGAKGIKRNPWANNLFIPGALGEYMDAQFRFFGNEGIHPQKKPIMAGLNYFLTQKARGGSSEKLLGEKKDVKVWLSWLERRVHNEVSAIRSPIGFLPCYKDLKSLFQSLIQKPYERSLYEKQFSLYVDHILKRNTYQIEAYGRENKVPERFFAILEQQNSALQTLRRELGSVVSPFVLADLPDNILKN